MNFTHYDLGSVRSGQIVEVALAGSAANIRLMDQANFECYTKNSRYGFIGGRVVKSPVCLQVPRDGRWHIAIDMRGLTGKVRTSFRLLKDSSHIVTQEFGFDSETGKAFNPKYDVFVVYASVEDEAIIGQSIEALRAKGLRVWPFELKKNGAKSLRDVIEKGLLNSWIGLILLSRSMLAYGSTREELITKNTRGEELLMLIRHEISIKELEASFPSLFNKPLIGAADYSPIDIADKTIRAINTNKTFFI